MLTTPHPSAHLSRQRLRGFTLIELMIAVAVIAILASVAYPSYKDAIRKSRRTDARNALLDLAARQERYYSQYNTYTSSITGSGSAGLGYSTTNIPSTGTTWYTVAITASSTTAFTITATPVAGSDQASDTCYQYVVDNLGQTSNKDASGNAVSSGITCW